MSQFQQPKLFILVCLLVPFVLCVGFSCKKKSDDDPSIDPTSKVFTNGKIYTVNPQQPWAEALWSKDGVIQFVGSTAEALSKAGTDAVTTDLGGKMMLPGLHDVHTHPLEARSPFSGTCVLDGSETDAEAYIPVLKNCAPQQIGTDWVLGWGHSVFTLLESTRNPVEILDEAIPDQPAVIMEETSHSVWVNSLALQAAGIDKDTPHPPGGIIVKDSSTGDPTGILFDAAGDLVMDLAWAPTGLIKELNYQGLLEALALLRNNGITSICDARTYWKRGFHEAWIRAEQEGQLTARTILGLWAYPAMSDAEQISKLTGLYRNNPNDLLRISQIKVYADGIIINTTAAMLSPYLQTLGQIPSNNGLNYFTETRLGEYIGALQGVGFDFHIHAIGDRGVHEALNAIEVNQSGSARHRITHLEVVDPADLSRFSALNVTADCQVAGDFANPEHWAENEPLIGSRSNNFIPLRSLEEADARITLSSDWDVSDLNPFVGIQNALTRSPQDISSLEAVIAAYTINAAYVMRQEHLVGSIEVGKKADLIVIDQQLFDIPVNRISQTKVLDTYLNGELIYHSP